MIKPTMNILSTMCLLLLWLTSLFAQSYEQQLAQSRSALDTKDYKQAQAAAERAIKLDPNRWEGYVFAANAYSSQRLYDDAIGMLQSALPKAPQDKKQLIRDSITDARKQAAGPPAPAVSSPAPNGPNPTMQEIVLWKSIEANPSEANLNAYLSSYPNGTYVPLARSHLNDLIAERDRRARAAEQQRIDDAKALSSFVGQQAPEFTLPFGVGGSVSLKDLRGRWVILYFCPHDITPGCQILSRKFQQNLSEYNKMNAVVVGVSVEDAKHNDDFTASFGITFKLLSDSGASVATRYRSRYDVPGRPTEASSKMNTFLITPKGTIQRVWSSVEIAKRSEEVLTALTEDRTAETNTAGNSLLRQDTEALEGLKGNTRLAASTWIGDDTLLYALDKHLQRDPKDKTGPKQRPAPLSLRLMPDGSCEFDFTYHGTWTNRGDEVMFRTVYVDDKNHFTMTVMFSGRVTANSIEGDATWTNTVTNSGSMHHFVFKRSQ